MRLLGLICWVAVAIAAPASIVIREDVPSTAGVEALVRRRLPQHVDNFQFAIVNASQPAALENDRYIVSTTSDGKILVEGNSLSALLSGLHNYLSNVVHVDVWWFIGSRLDVAPNPLPKLATPLKGSSVVPYRYHFNTVTTSYSSAFWTWDDWELQLDWMALRGINLPLAWIGVEKIFIEVFQEIGLTDEEIDSFMSGPAFLAWNHFGNIQGSWGGSLPSSWVDDQFALQKKIVQRMVELGMTPILPAFPGFVPRAITRVFPEASVVNGSQWEGFPALYTNDTFLDPLDPLFEQLQISFISKQKAAYGNVTSFYALDQYNENNPASGDLDYLRNVTLGTWQSLKAADSEAVWVMQGWLFTSSAAFWTNERIESYLSGVPVDSDLLILDLFSESQPQWQRTNSYYGKPWIWCQLHDYGGNMGLYGQIMNITYNPIEALQNSSSLVGFGLSMEGQEGNEIVYDLLLDQAWSSAPVDTEVYFRHWAKARYAGNLCNSASQDLYLQAWEVLRPTVFNNTNLTANAVPKAIFELIPSISGLVNRTGHHPTKFNYDPSVMVEGLDLLFKAGLEDTSLFSNPAYNYDLVDWTRQVLANAFIPIYEQLVATYTATNQSSKCREAKLKAQGKSLTDLLATLDTVLAADVNFKLSTWIAAARASDSTGSAAVGDFLEYEARNQVTLWGPTGQINDYASKSWAGLVSGYYLPRWQMFVEYLLATDPSSYNQTEFNAQLLEWELTWVDSTSTDSRVKLDEAVNIQALLPNVLTKWVSGLAPNKT
ncbi:Alpha-N-acetylglucosaminidase [Pleurostoma richardsiae]|uniref:Alpha-N-acetylglucosaminidase n=1 Tax=Pleurostoma richardsiae TaxID=41990 RepID=A0AA38VQE8_9PEZI|nr:Alpha-N-acetylglucosaminidase [Pleurostoma richardsiae]